MNLLLDTHTLLWFIDGDQQLPNRVVESICDTQNRCYVSIASLWEIVIKMSLGKLEIKDGIKTITDFIEQNTIEVLPIELEDILNLQHLEFHHRDPFDRLLISQAQTSDLIIISRDSLFAQYQVKIMW